MHGYSAPRLQAGVRSSQSSTCYGLQDIVLELIKEASLLGSLRHPNM
jgi:hypothetical protein